MRRGLSLTRMISGNISSRDPKEKPKEAATRMWGDVFIGLRDVREFSVASSWNIYRHETSHGDPKSICTPHLMQTPLG